MGLSSLGNAPADESFSVSLRTSRDGASPCVQGGRVLSSATRAGPPDRADGMVERTSHDYPGSDSLYDSGVLFRRRAACVRVIPCCLSLLRRLRIFALVHACAAHK